MTNLVPFTYLQTNTSSDKWVYNASDVNFVMAWYNDQLQNSLGNSSLPNKRLKIRVTNVKKHTLLNRVKIREQTCERVSTSWKTPFSLRAAGALI